MVGLKMLTANFGFARLSKILKPSWNTRCFSSDKMTVDVDSKTGIATLEMNAPPVNSLITDSLTSYVKAIKFVEKESDIRGALLKSKFDGKVFGAGLNIEDFYQKSPSHISDFWTCVQDWYIAWFGCKKPTAAVINGHAPAGGCAFALMCDYRVMQGGAGKVIGMNESRVGIAPPFYLNEALVSVIGQRKAEAALLNGTLFSAEEAKEIGLVDEIDKLENITAIATAKLEKLIAVPPIAYATTKMLIRQNVINRLIKVKREDADNFVAMVSHPTVEEAIGNYLKNLKSRKKQ